MNKLISVKSVLLFLLSIFLISCGGGKKVVRQPIEGNNTVFILNQVKQSELDFETFSAKAGITITEDKKITSFKVNLRIKSDSAIWISITPLFGIEMARVLITEDSVKVIDRMDKKYFLGDFDYINKKFNLDLEYSVLQSLLLGNMISFEEEEDLRFARDKNFYYLGNLKKRKAKKVEDNPQKITRKSEELISFWIDPQNYKLKEVILTDLNADKFIQGTYSEHQEINGQWVPSNLNFTIQSENTSSIHIDYSRIELDEDISFPFNISSKYERASY